MGCDIHLYVEYKNKKETNYRNFGGRINPGRNYYIFGLLAKGVRSDLPEGIELKGLPDRETMSYMSRGENEMFIHEDGGEGFVTPETAERWVKSGSSKYIGKDKNRITHPEWHSHSWLTTEEYEKQLNVFLNHPDAKLYAEPEYEAVLAILKSFESGGYDARIVFWFDN